MDNKNSSKLAQLLAQDPESRDFFTSLSHELRCSLMKQDISTFEHLKECALQYHSGDNYETDSFFDYYNPVCSSNDCTGLIPQGSNKTSEGFDEYKNIYPFSNPPHSEQ